MFPDGLRSPLQSCLDRAARRYRRDLAAARDAEREGFEFAFLLSRLDMPPGTVASAQAARRAGDLPPEMRGRIAARLGRENQRLCRLARSGAAGYDLSRHLAVRRALSWVNGKAPSLPPEGASGSVLNARFRRHRPRG